MIYYRLICWTNGEEESTGCIDFQTKAAALAAFRCICETITSPDETTTFVEVYEMHDDEKRSYAVCTFSWDRETTT